MQWQRTAVAVGLVGLGVVGGGLLIPTPVGACSYVCDTDSRGLELVDLQLVDGAVDATEPEVPATFWLEVDIDGTPTELRGDPWSYTLIEQGDE